MEFLRLVNRILFGSKREFDRDLWLRLDVTDSVSSSFEDSACSACIPNSFFSPGCKSVNDRGLPQIDGLLGSIFVTVNFDPSEPPLFSFLVCPLFSDSTFSMRSSSFSSSEFCDPLLSISCISSKAGIWPAVDGLVPRPKCIVGKDPRRPCLDLAIGGGDAGGESLSSSSLSSLFWLFDSLAIFEKKSFCLRESIVGSRLPLLPDNFHSGLFCPSAENQKLMDVIL